MADIVLIDLRASYSQFTTATRQAAGELGKVSTSGKKAGSDVTKSFNQADQSVKKLNADLKSSNVHLNTASKTAKSATSTFNGMGTSLAAIGATMGIGLGLQTFIHLAKDSIDAASNLNETVSKTGELFGQSTEAVLNWSKGTAESIGQSQQAALDAASTFAIFGRAAGLSGARLVDFSTDFTELASDLASFNNTSPEEAVMAIGAALRGEAEPIRRYGVLLDEATIKQEAITLGIIKTTKEALTPQQKVLAVQAAIYKQTAAAQGDFARTSDGLANQQRILNAQWQNMKATLGTELLPIVLDYVGALNALIGLDFKKFGQVLDQNLFHQVEQVVGVLENLGILTEKYVDNLTNFEKRTLDIVNATDKEVEALIEQNKAIGNNTEEMEKFIKTVRESAIQDTFKELAQAIEITADQYARLVSISDQYGISARINSSLILDIKQSTEQDLNNAFIKFNKTLGVSKKDWDDYIGLVKEIPPKHDELGNSVKTKLVGPYEALTKALGGATTSLQDYAALSLRSQSFLDILDKATNKVKESQFRLALANNLVTISMGDYKKELEDVSQFMDAEGKFIFDIPGGDEAAARINEIILNFQQLQAMDKELAAMQEERKKRDEEAIKRKEDDIARNKELLEHRMADEEFAQNFLTELGIRGVKDFETRFMELEELRKNDLLGAREYIQALAVLQLQEFAATSSALGELAGTLSNTLAAIFGDAAKKNAEFASFIQTLTITEILFKQGAAIANAIEKLTTAVDPFQIIAGIASLIASVGGVFSGIIQTVQSTAIPEPPSFYAGTPYLQLGGNPKGKDTIPLYGNEGEAIIPADANSDYPGLSKAWIDGGLDNYIIDRWVTPALIKQEKEIKNDFAKNIANSLLLQSGIFNDKNIVKLLKQQRNIQGQGFVELIDAVKQKPKKRGGYA